MSSTLLGDLMSNKPKKDKKSKKHRKEKNKKKQPAKAKGLTKRFIPLDDHAESVSKRLKTTNELLQGLNTQVECLTSCMPGEDVKVANAISGLDIEFGPIVKAIHELDNSVYDLVQLAQGQQDGTPLVNIATALSNIDDDFVTDIKDLKNAAEAQSGHTADVAEQLKRLADHFCGM